jgi:hypothetical protein
MPLPSPAGADEVIFLANALSLMAKIVRFHISQRSGCHQPLIEARFSGVKSPLTAGWVI